MWWTTPTRLIVRPTGAPAETRAVSGPGSYVVGPVVVTIELSSGDLSSGDLVPGSLAPGGSAPGDTAAGRWSWSVAGAGPDAVALDAVALQWDVGEWDAGGWDAGRPAMFVHGYQSWAPTRTRRLGVDEDPSRHRGSIELVRAAYHADPGVTEAGELRSEQVTVLDLGPGRRWCIGFTGGHRHAGTLRARRMGSRLAVTAEAWFGGAVVGAGELRLLHDVVARVGDDGAALLDEWAATVGAAANARVGAPFQVGWCSWYHYFHDVDEGALHDNLARAAQWPFDVFQLDDGYQAAIGDWLATNEKFPCGVDGIAAAIAAAGYAPGIWIAPFIAAPESDVARRHPEWLARAPRGERPAIGMTHEVWGGVMWQLDTTHPDALEHLERTAAALVDAGYRYLKLDFTFSAAMPGRFHDPHRTPAERVRAGYDAIRRGAGDDTFILGCGAPLGAVVGAVDAMRIGADVAPWWNPPPGAAALPGYEDAAPATRHAFVNTCTRAFQHRRLWLNDPDCLMLRTTETAMTAEAMRGWATVVGASGGLALVSDDLARLGPDARRLLDEVLALGREADAGARADRAPRCPDVLDPAGPRTLAVGGTTVTVDPETGRARLAPAPV